MRKAHILAIYPFSISDDNFRHGHLKRLFLNDYISITSRAKRILLSKNSHLLRRDVHTKGDAGTLFYTMR